MKSLLHLVKRLLLWLKQTWAQVHERSSRPRPLRATHAEDLPDQIKKGVVYLIGENDCIWCAALICPCGCGATIQLNTLADVRPQWKVTEHPNKTVSLHPSVWRQVGCRSHFFVRRGLIEWCGE